MLASPRLEIGSQRKDEEERDAEKLTGEIDNPNQVVPDDEKVEEEEQKMEAPAAPPWMDEED